MNKRSKALPGGNATAEKAVVARANEFERTGLFWEITRWKGGKEQEAKPCRRQGQILEGSPQALQSRLDFTRHQGTSSDRETCSDWHTGRKIANKFP